MRGGGGVGRGLTKNARCRILRKPQMWGEAGISRGVVRLDQATHHGRAGVATHGESAERVFFEGSEAGQPRRISGSLS